MILSYLMLAIIVFIAALVQSTSGFGFGIIFMAVMPLILPYKECNVLTLATVLCLQVYTVIKFRRHINYRMVIVPAIAALIFGSIGVHLMISMSGTAMTDAILKPAPTHARTIGRLSIGVIILTSKLINEIMVPATAAVIIRANRSQPSVGAIAVKVLPIKKTVINSIRRL